MANVHAALMYVMSFEDASLSGVVTRDAGGLTRFGIAQADNPGLPPDFYSMPASAALGIAIGIMGAKYAAPLKIAVISDQNLANKVLSIGVNIGVAQGAMLLQQAVNIVNPKAALVIDGVIGPVTLAAVNVLAPVDVLAKFKALTIEFYQKVVAANPVDSQYLDGWLNRVNAP